VHWVTKVFIVGAAVLSVLLAALVMAYSVNVKEIRDDRANLLAQKQAAEAYASNQATESAAARTTLNQVISDKEDELALLRQQNAQLQAENSAARADKFRADSNVDSITQKIAQLSETTKTQMTLIQTLTDEVRAQRESELKYRTREIELVDRNNDLESQKEVLQAQARALFEQVSELQAMNEAIRGGGAAVADGGAPVPLNAFSGRVTDIRKSQTTGELLAEINLGANDGVKDRMELWLARDGTLLGKLTVIKTDLRSAVGRVDTLSIKGPNNKPYEIKAEDRVYSSVFN
jgi:uncharacterized protein YhaN